MAPAAPRIFRHSTPHPEAWPGRLGMFGGVVEGSGSWDRQMGLVCFLFFVGGVF